MTPYDIPPFNPKDFEKVEGVKEGTEPKESSEIASKTNDNGEDTLQLLSYQSVVRAMRKIEEGNEFYNVATKAGINGELPFFETPMYKYLMRFVGVPPFLITEEQKQKVEKNFFTELFCMLVFDETTSWRLEPTAEGVELVVTSEDTDGFFENKVSEMTLEELQSLMTSVIVEAWPDYNYTLSSLFPEENQIDADFYIDDLRDYAFPTQTEFLSIYTRYAQKSGLDLDVIKKWYSKLEDIEFATLRFRY